MTRFPDIPTNRRLTRQEMSVRTARAPRFVHPAPSAAVLDGLVRTYEDITDELVRSVHKRNMLAACYRVHGGRYSAVLYEAYESRGRTTMNLLAVVRYAEPDDLIHDLDAEEEARRATAGAVRVG